MPIRIINGDLFSSNTILEHGYDCVLFSANAVLDKNDCLVMGAGAALDAKKLMPDLPHILGRKLKCLQDESRSSYGVILHNNGDRYYGAFQAKVHWRNPSTTDVIRNSSRVLAFVLEKNTY